MKNIIVLLVFVLVLGSFGKPIFSQKRVGSSSRLLTIKNSTDFPIAIYWLRSNGTTKFYRTLESGKDYRLKTYIQHRWQALDEKGNLLAEFQVPTNIDTTWTIHGKGNSSWNDTPPEPSLDPSQMQSAFDQETNTICVSGFSAIVNPALRESNPKQLSQVIQTLEINLQYALKVTPPHTHDFLKSVVYWIDESPDFSGMVYHPSANWLSRNGHNPKKAKSVQISNLANFIAWHSGKPWFIIHELAHAYHHQVLTYQYQKIKDVYENAKRQKLYDLVERNDGRMRKAYAQNNSREYFAELSEAFFGTNDYFPFNRQQLKKHDPMGYQMVIEAWRIK